VGVTTWTEPPDRILAALDDLRPVDRPPAVAAGSGATRAAAGATPAADDGGSAEPDRLDRVLLVGDSVMSQAYDQHQARFTAAGIQTWFAGGPSTGPLSPQGSWAEQVGAWVAAEDPDVVVIEACCNYTTGVEERYVGADGKVVEPRTDAVLPAWEREIRTLVDVAGAGGARVALVRFGPVQTNGWYGPMEEHVAGLDAMYLRLAAELGVDIVDWASTLAPGGAFAWDLPIDGESVRVRLEDGLHLTPAGSDLVARATLDQVVALASEPDRVDGQS
jgi:hypothetical protein